MEVLNSQIYVHKHFSFLGTSDGPGGSMENSQQQQQQQDQQQSNQYQQSGQQTPGTYSHISHFFKELIKIQFCT